MSTALTTSVIDWDTCKIQYEVLGDSLERIAVTHGIPFDSLLRVADEEAWEQLTPTAENLNNYLSSVLNSHKAKLSLAMLYRELEMFPRVAEIENLLLDKLKSVINQVDTSDPKAASQLRALGQGINSITERQTILKDQLAGMFKDDDKPQDVSISMDFDHES